MNKLVAGHDSANTDKLEVANPARATVKPSALRVKSGVRGGDVYMHNPPGSNNRLHGG